MRIGIIAPLWKRVPPERYGGTELVVYNLTEGLIERGHEVTLFASGDSVTRGELIPIVEKNLYDTLGGFDWKELSYDILQAERVASMAQRFDVIHNHNGFVFLAFTSFIKTPVVTTLHSSLPPEPEILARNFKDRYFVSISNAQRELAPYLRYIDTVYHGIDVERFPFSDKKGEYLLFLGTYSPYKGPHIAIEVSKRSGIPLILAGEMRPEFEEYFKKDIEPHEDGRNIIIKYEVDFGEKVELLKRAKALLMPVRWQEAFGLVMIEAMACGTPVIGFMRGAIPEVVIDGKTGFIVSDMEGMVKALNDIDRIPRTLCRRHVEENFTIDVMVRRYERVYEKIKDCTGSPCN